MYLNFFVVLFCSVDHSIQPKHDKETPYMEDLPWDDDDQNGSAQYNYKIMPN